MHEPCLQWVKINEEVRHVSDFANLPPDQRPNAFCPVCSQPVLLKLGQVRVHHAAHYEGTICITTQAETAIHLNAKYHIKQELNTKKQLKIWQQCKGWNFNDYKHECINQNKRVIVFVENWDHVEVEWGYSNYRLDIALIKSGQVIGAIEVFVTHQSEESKLTYLNEQGVAWTEIKVGQDFYTPPTAWKAEIPLEVLRCNHYLLNEWQCPNCFTSHKKEQKQQEEHERYLQEKQQKLEYAKQFETKFLRLIDFYYPSKKKYRQIYEIQTKSEKGKVAYACLNAFDYKDGRIIRHQLKIEYPQNFGVNFESLKSILENDLKTKNNNWLIDDSRNWFSPQKRFHPKQFMDLDKYPYNYELINDQWKKIEYKANISEPFEPHYFVPKNLLSSTEEQSPKLPEPENQLAFLTAEYPCEKCGQVTSDWVQRFGKTKTCICRECANKS